ncbi:MAG TPA: type II/IV secretion system protein, partial [Bradyrhizobium sp.]
MPPRAHARVGNSASPALTRPLREFWETTDLSAAEFADELSDYFALPRLSLPQLLTTTPRLDGFSRRFLRESTIFPFGASNGGFRLAVADPSDTAAIRAAEIVFGMPVD